MRDDPPPTPLLPILVLAGMIALGLVVWLGFPFLQAWVAHQDCVATGRTNCG